MARAMFRTSVDSYDARVSIRSLYEATQLIRRGALTDDVIKAAYRVMDRKFNAHMAAQAAARDDLTHVFDWGLIGSPSGRLWKTNLEGRGSNRSVYFIFLPSRRKVPFDPQLDDVLRRRHVFKRKAEIFEHGEEVTISPRYAKFLVYINRHKGAGYTNSDSDDKTYRKGKITFTTRTSVINQAGNGKFQGRFTAEFIRFWSSLDNTAQLADELGKSTSVQYARAAGAKKRMARYQSKLNDPSAEARSRANAAIQNIKKQMRGKR